MNDYLEQMQECVQSIKTIQLLKHKKQRSTSDMARASSFQLLSAQDTKKSININNAEEKQGETNNTSNIDERAEDELDDDDDNEEDVETLLGVLETNDDEIQLSKLHELIQDSKECVSDLNKQQVT